MTYVVSDVGSNLNENLERWSRALARGGDKLRVFNVVYSSKRKRWTAKEISRALNGNIHPYDVPNIAKKLVGDGLLHQLPGSWPVVYTKISEIQHYKSRILRLARNARKRSALPTKRKPRLNVKLNVAARAPKSGRAVEITIDDIDQFARVRKKSKTRSALKPLPEADFKRGLLEVLGETGRFPDSGVGRDDFITNRLTIKGRRHTAAFALKGPGLTSKTMSPAKWGKRGNQIQKLVSAPAQVFILQAEKQIDEDSLEQLQNLVEHKATSQHRTLYYGHIDRADSLRLRRAYAEFF
jgi:hypothetical protein